MVESATKTKHQIKGTALLSLKDFCIHQGIEPLFDTAVSSCGMDNTRFLASQWYDGESYLKMCEYLAFKSRKSTKGFIVELSAHTAKNDLNGVYRAILRVTGVKIILSKLPVLASSYTDYIKSSVILNEKQEYHIEFITPSKFFDLTTWNFEGAVSSMLKVFNHRVSKFSVISKSKFEKEGESYTKGICQLKYEPVS